MNPTILLTSLVRLMLGAFGGWTLSKNIGSLSDGTIANLTQLIVGGISLLVPYVWSVLTAHKRETKINDLQGYIGKNPDVNSPPFVERGSGTKLLSFFLVGFLCLFSMGCAVISHFDQNSLESAKRLKFQTLQLISHGTEKPDAYIEQIKALESDLSLEIRYESGKGNRNIASRKQWEILASPNHLLGRFLREWREGKRFSQTYVDEDSKIIADTFDSIVELEGAKEK